jgi:hypothetical protein
MRLEEAGCEEGMEARGPDGGSQGHLGGGFRPFRDWKKRFCRLLRPPETPIITKLLA